MSLTRTFPKLILPIAITAALTACGGGGGGGGTTTTPTTSPTSLGGSASKGIILDGIVTAYTVTATGEKDQSVASDRTSDTDGTYSLEIPADYQGLPLIIEITADGTTLMKCDLTQCRADDPATTDIDESVTFGDTYPLSNSFALKALTSGTSGSTLTVNVTPLTDLGAKLAVSNIANNPGMSPATAAAAANGQVRDMVGISSGDITQLPIVDITNADSVAAADSAALEYNLKATAVVQAALATLQNSDADGTLEEALEAFGSNIANGIPGNGSDDSATSLEEILEASQSLLTEVLALGGLGDDPELTAISNKVNTEEADAQTTGSSTPSLPPIPDDVGSEGLIATKGFVNQVRDFATAWTMESSNPEDPSDYDALGAFADELDLVNASIAGDTDVAVMALEQAAAAVVEANIAYEENGELTSFEFNGITVTITPSSSGVTFSINQNVSVFDEAQVEHMVAVDITAAATLVDGIESDETISGTEPPDVYSGEAYSAGTFGSLVTENGTITASLAISGSASTDTVSISIAEGSSFSGSLTVEYSSDYNESWPDYQAASGAYSATDDVSETLTADEISLDLTVEIAQLDQGQATSASFSGELSLSIDQATLSEMYVYESTYSYDYDGETQQVTENWSDSEEGTDTAGFSGLSFSLAGTFTNGTSSVSASAALTASGLSDTCNWLWEDSYTDGNYTNIFTDECATNETESEYSSAVLSVIFNVDIDGIAAPVNVAATITRTGLEDGTATVDLTYGGKSLNFSYDGGEALTVTNHNSVTLVLTETETAEGDTYVSGTISHGGEQFATVSDEEFGYPVVEFTDGSNVTL